MFTDETLPATDNLFPYQFQGHVNIDLYVYDRKQLQYAGFAPLGHAASHSTPLQDMMIPELFCDPLAHFQKRFTFFKKVLVSNKFSKTFQSQKSSTFFKKVPANLPPLHPKKGMMGSELFFLGPS